jgi:hypothetical protein
MVTMRDAAMLVAKEIVDTIIGGVDDDHDNDESWDYGTEVVVDLGGVLGIQRFDLRRIVFNRKDKVIEFRNFDEAAPYDEEETDRQREDRLANQVEEGGQAGIAGPVGSY